MSDYLGKAHTPFLLKITCRLHTSMFPDLVVIRADVQGYVFDILEPPDPNRKNNYPKAVGLAKFAEKH